MKILVLNCGSSSIKYQVISINKESALLAKGCLTGSALQEAS
ncbi:MAG: hypothetical protein MZV63_06430 [Marinilabiliales bacterium]|nr:hypothetical protein [Marinilabiliales bacterium]